MNGLSIQRPVGVIPKMGLIDFAFSISIHNEVKCKYVLEQRRQLSEGGGFYLNLL
jgi:hypothetical protein